MHLQRAFRLVQACLSNATKNQPFSQGGREVSQEQEGQHAIAEVVRVHRTAKLVGDFPKSVAELFLVGVVHRGALVLKLKLHLPSFGPILTISKGEIRLHAV